MTTAVTPGQMAGGVLRVGDEVVVLPSGRSTTDQRDRHLRRAARGGVPDDVGDAAARGRDRHLRGDMIVDAEEPPTVARELEASICWMSEEPLRAGGALPDQAHHPHAPARSSRSSSTGSTSTRSSRPRRRPSSRSTRSAACELRTSAPLVVDPYARNRAHRQLHPDRRVDQRHRRRRDDRLRALSRLGGAIGTALSGVASFSQQMHAFRSRIGLLWPALGWLGSVAIALAATRVLDRPPDRGGGGCRCPAGTWSAVDLFWAGVIVLCVAWLGVGRRTRAPHRHRPATCSLIAAAVGASNRPGSCAVQPRHVQLPRSGRASAPRPRTRTGWLRLRWSAGTNRRS